MRGPLYTIVTAESLSGYRAQIEGKRQRRRLEYAWLHEYLELWARWHAGEFHDEQFGRGGVLPAYNENHDIPKCTATDVNGTGFIDLMLDIERAYSKLPSKLSIPVACFYLKDLGRTASAVACGLSEDGFDGRLNLAYHHIARLMNFK